MDGINSMMGSIKTMVNYHICKLFGLQQSGNIENSERMDDFNEEDIWGSIDAETSEHFGFEENVCNGVALCRSMGNEGKYNNIRRSVKGHQMESCHEESNNRTRLGHQSSAPVNIPNWSDMVWEEKREETGWSRAHEKLQDCNSDDEKGGDLEIDMMIPPHEVIARQLARSEMAAFSLYEGTGRTLRGRDAIWTITGFIE